MLTLQPVRKKGPDIPAHFQMIQLLQLQLSVQRFFDAAL